jgi:peptide/nickel transport system permease protein
VSGVLPFQGRVIQYVQARVLALALVLALMSLIVFSFVHLIPGDPVVAMLGTEVDQTTQQSLRRAMGLDRPIPAQYALWVGRALHGDFGRSVRTHEPVSAILAQKLPVTLELTLAAVVVGLCIALPAGVLAATRRNSVVDLGAMGISLAGVSIPSFWLGVMLILLFSLHWPLFPSIGYVPFSRDPASAVRHLVLPAVTLGLGLAGTLTRMIRSDVLEELGREYVRTARAKGLRFGRVINRHVLRNALLPTLTVLGVQVSVLLGGAVITEQIFAWPGVGQLIVQAIQSRDYPVLQGAILVVAVLAAVVQLAVDLAYALMNPRIRFG